MKRLALGLLLAVLVGQVDSRTGQAQEAVPEPVPAVIQSEPTVVEYPASMADAPQARVSELAHAVPGRNHPFLAWFRRPCGCWATQDSLGCGSLRGEYLFIFGSCRQFFDEGCEKDRPPLGAGAAVRDAGVFHYP